MQWIKHLYDLCAHFGYKWTNPLIHNHDGLVIFEWMSSNRRLNVYLSKKDIKAQKLKFIINANNSCTLDIKNKDVFDYYFLCRYVRTRNTNHTGISCRCCCFNQDSKGRWLF